IDEPMHLHCPQSPKLQDSKAASRAAESVTTSIESRFHTAWTQSGRSPPLLDDLVGASEQGMWHSETERLRSLEVDHQVEFRELLHRQIGRFDAFENPSGVSAEQVKGRSNARPIADQAAGIDGRAPRIGRRNGMA